MTNSKFDYSAIPTGYYQHVLETGSPVRRAWHYQKFKRVLDCLPEGNDLSILDIGCFAGTFLSLVDERRYSRQLGVDILANQVDYANAHFGTPHRSFQYIESLKALSLVHAQFDCITIIEVIEHLASPEVSDVLEHAAKLLPVGGTLILTTPNYVSTWPLLELVINRLSEVSNEEQHITRFNYFNILRKLPTIWPPFEESFAVQFLTSTHFGAPFLAPLSFEWSNRISRQLDHRKWRFPFGNLLLLSLRRT